MPVRRGRGVPEDLRRHGRRPVGSPRPRPRAVPRLGAGHVVPDGGRRGGRLRAARAVPPLRRGPPFPPRLQGRPLRRGDDRVDALPAVGPGPRGGAQRPQHQGDDPARRRGRLDPHGAPRPPARRGGRLPVPRVGAGAGPVPLLPGRRQVHREEDRGRCARGTPRSARRSTCWSRTSRRGAGGCATCRRRSGGRGSSTSATTWRSCGRRAWWGPGPSRRSGTSSTTFSGCGTSSTTCRGRKPTSSASRCRSGWRSGSATGRSGRTRPSSGSCGRTTSTRPPRRGSPTRSSRRWGGSCRRRGAGSRSSS